LTEAAGASYGMGMINLIPWDDREESVDDVIAQMQDLTKNIKGADIQYFPPPTVPGFGNASGFELRIQDRSGKDDLQETAQIINEFVQALNEAPEIREAFTSFDANFPQYLIHIDTDMAAKKGVTVENAM